ncbi:MAG TPA: hypothetical protein VFQ72_01615 [Candidatus Paceibacterota bacterium]|nr:hypothetical protein [Candidatus Paceibacterota bacterium]
MTHSTLPPERVFLIFRDAAFMLVSAKDGVHGWDIASGMIRDVTPGQTELLLREHFAEVIVESVSEVRLLELEQAGSPFIGTMVYLCVIAKSSRGKNGKVYGVTRHNLQVLPSGMSPRAEAAVALEYVQSRLG